MSMDCVAGSLNPPSTGVPSFLVTGKQRRTRTTVVLLAHCLRFSILVSSAGWLGTWAAASSWVSARALSAAASCSCGQLVLGLGELGLELSFGHGHWLTSEVNKPQCTVELGH